MAPVRRCVFGCLTDGITLHNFPNPRRFPEQYKKWVELVGEPVEDLPPDEIFGKKKVCDLHFTIDDRNRNNRLNAIATPVPFPCLKRRRNRPKSNRTLVENQNFMVAENEHANMADSAGASSPREEAHHDDVQDAALNFQEEEMVPDAQETAFEDVAEEHIGFTCNVCHLAITGFRYTCVQCNDLDLCGACEADKAHDHHYMLRIPASKPTHEIQAILESIRGHVATVENFADNNNQVDVSFKSEMNSEGEDEGVGDEAYGLAPNNDLEVQDPAFAESEVPTSANQGESDPLANEAHDVDEGPEPKRSRITMTMSMEPVASTSAQEPDEIAVRAGTPQPPARSEMVYRTLAVQAQLEVPSLIDRAERRPNGTNALNANQIRIRAVARRRRNHSRALNSPNIRNLGSVRLILRLPRTILRPNSNQA